MLKDSFFRRRLHQGRSHTKNTRVQEGTLTTLIIWSRSKGVVRKRSQGEGVVYEIGPNKPRRRVYSPL